MNMKHVSALELLNILLNLAFLKFIVFFCYRMMDSMDLISQFYILLSFWSCIIVSYAFFLR